MPARKPNRKSRRPSTATTETGRVDHGRRRSRRRLVVLLGALLAVVVSAVHVGASRARRSDFEKAMQARRLVKAETLVDRPWWPFGSLADETVMRARLARLRGEDAAATAFLNFAESAGDAPRRIELERRLLAIQSGQVAASVDELSSLLQSHPDEGPIIFEAFVNINAASGRFDQALSLLTIWGEADPTSALVDMHRGEVLLAVDAYDDAVTAFRRSLARNEHVLRSRIGLTEALNQLQSSGEALQQARLVLAEDPTNITILNTAAGLLSGPDDGAERERLLRLMLAIDPDNYDATLSLGRLLCDRQEFPQAFEVLVKLESFHPLDASLNYLLAQAATGLGRQADAAKYLEQHFASKAEIDRLTKIKRSRSDDRRSLDDERTLALGFMKFEWKSAGPHLMRIQQAAGVDPEVSQAINKFSRQMN